MITLTVTGESAAEVISQLAGFTNGLKGVPAQETAEQPAETKTGETRGRPRKATTETSKPEVTKEAETKTEDDGLGGDGLEETKAYTIEEIRKIGREHGQRVGVDKVRGLIKELGAENLNVLDSSKYHEFVEKVKLLK